MTVTTETSTSGPFNGPGPTFSWASFDVFAASDLEVIETTPEGVNTIKVLNVDYTVNLVTHEITAIGAWFLSLTSSHDVTIKRKLPLTQNEDPTNQGALDPEQHLEAWDRAAMIDQQQQEESDRCYKIDVGESFDPDALVADRFVHRPKLLASHVVPNTGPAVTHLEAFVSDSEIYDRLRCEIAYVFSVGSSVGRTLQLQYRHNGSWHTALYTYAYRSLSSGGTASVVNAGTPQAAIALSAASDFTRGVSYGNGVLEVSSPPSLSHTAQCAMTIAIPAAGSTMVMLRGGALMNSFLGHIEGFRVFTDGVTAEVVGTIRLWGLPKS